MAHGGAFAGGMYSSRTRSLGGRFAREFTHIPIRPYEQVGVTGNLLHMSKLSMAIIDRRGGFLTRCNRSDSGINVAIHSAVRNFKGDWDGNA